VVGLRRLEAELGEAARHVLLDGALVTTRRWAIPAFESPRP
jgi:hypothetical protein